MPKISVLMPIYKTKEAHLRMAIESILSQTFRDFELLILNDSPENTLLDEIVQSYPDKRIRYLKNEKNNGISASRNRLLEIAQGEYVAIMDHDDISMPQRFEKQSDYLNDNPLVGVVGCLVDCFPEQIKLYFPAEDVDIKALLMEICAVVHSGSMIRMSVLTENDVVYEQRYSPSEDYFLWCQLIEFTQFHNLQEVLLQYRRHEDNTSKHERQRMRQTANQIRLFVRNKYLYLYHVYLEKRETLVFVKLFKFIPLLMVRNAGNEKRYYIFNRIPVLVVRKKNVSWLNRS